MDPRSLAPCVVLNITLPSGLFSRSNCSTSNLSYNRPAQQPAQQPAQMSGWAKLPHPEGDMVSEQEEMVRKTKSKWPSNMHPSGPWASAVQQEEWLLHQAWSLRSTEPPDRPGFIPQDFPEPEQLQPYGSPRHHAPSEPLPDTAYPSSPSTLIVQKTSIMSDQAEQSCSSRKTLNVESPAFTPSITAAAGSTITSRAASAAPFTPRAAASGMCFFHHVCRDLLTDYTGTSTPSVPEELQFNPARVREFTPQGYDASQAVRAFFSF